MDRLLPLFVAIAVVITGYRMSSARCRLVPSRRRWIILGSIGALVVAALLVPWVLAKLDPPWSESPAGIFVYLGKALIVGILGLGALGALIGAIAPGRSDPAA